MRNVHDGGVHVVGWVNGRVLLAKNRRKISVFVQKAAVTTAVKGQLEASRQSGGREIEQ